MLVFPHPPLCRLPHVELSVVAHLGPALGQDPLLPPLACQADSQTCVLRRSFGFKLDLPPVQDSPSTPVSPSSPFDISGPQKDFVQTPSTPHISPNSNLWTQLGVNCQRKPASAEVYCVDFVPKSIDSAIKYFRSQPRPFPPKFPRHQSGTPLSSKSTSMRCHGCHGIIGQGAHLGSGTGRNVCTLVHSNTC